MLLTYTRKPFRNTAPPSSSGSYDALIPQHSLGPPCRVFSRRNLTKVLYDTLPDEVKAKIISSKRVSDVVSTDDGVTVECRDGSSYDGTIVVGADGAHSKVRECLRKLAVKAGSPNINPEKPFLTTYRALWLRFATPDIEGIGAGDATETHGYGISTQLFAGADSGVTGMYERLPEPTRERIRYTQEDQDEMVKRYGHIRLAPKTKSNLTLQEAYDKRLESGIINLEEGVIPHWSWGSRVVLIGDAAHKFTPITGSGCNQSIVDVVALSNELYKAVSEARARSGGKSSRPSPEQLEAAFTAYQERRFTSASAHCMRAGMVSASASWTTRFARFMDLYIMPISFIQRYFYSKGASKEAHMPVLTYVAGKEHWHGTIPWVYPIPTSVETKAY